jgi:hypothetical protein
MSIIFGERQIDYYISPYDDHGIHTNDEGHGTHGSDLPEDLNVMHFYGLYPKKQV